MSKTTHYRGDDPTADTAVKRADREKLATCQRFTIMGNLVGLNEYTAANRRNKYEANQIKGQCEHMIQIAIRSAKLRPVTGPVRMTYRWIEPNRRRDKDNIAFARKFIQDALVKCRILANDGWTDIEGWRDEFDVDRQRPRIEVILEEVRA